MNNETRGLVNKSVTHKIMDSMLNKDQLQERLEEVEYWPELISELSFYLNKYVREKDLNLVRSPDQKRAEDS